MHVYHCFRTYMKLMTSSFSVYFGYNVLQGQPIGILTTETNGRIYTRGRRSRPDDLNTFS